MLPVAILAGGLGTRLGPLARAVPKLLVDVNGEPFAHHQLRWLRANGIERVVYCLGHLGEQVVATLGSGQAWDMRFEFVMDGPVLLGTGGAIRRALPALGAEFFVLYGDSLLTCDMGAVERAFRTAGRAALMTVYRNDDRWDRSNIVFRDGEILTYDKQHRTDDMHYIDYGLGILTAAALAPYPVDAPLDLASVYRDQLTAGQLAGYEVPSRFYEIGSPSGLEETRAFLNAQRPSS